MSEGSHATTLIHETIDAHLEVMAALKAQAGEIEAMANLVIAALQKGNKICFFGNGGSAADAQHMSAEIVVRYVRNRRALPAIAFTTDTSILTAAANDFGYESVFARQVEGLCVPGDIVAGLSTSGSSANVARGLEQARDMGLTTFAFTGSKDGPCAESADHTFRVPSEVTARIQEGHYLVWHMICDLAEQAFLDT